VYVTRNFTEGRITGVKLEAMSISKLMYSLKSVTNPNQLTLQSLYGTPPLILANFFQNTERLELHQTEQLCNVRRAKKFLGKRRLRSAVRNSSSSCCCAAAAPAALLLLFLGISITALPVRSKQVKATSSYLRGKGVCHVITVSCIRPSYQLH
jgi:hypothetical protein